MLALASHFKRRALIAAMVLIALPASQARAADPAFLPDIAPPSAFPDPSHATRKEGLFLPPATLRLLTPGMTKRQAYALLGAPHFHEGFFGEHVWDYILNFYTGTGTAYRICRLQLRWDRQMRLGNVTWSAEECRAALYPPVTEKVEATPPAPAPAPQNQSLSVYFDFDRADLSQAAQRDLAAFAASIADSGHSLSIVGYTDRAGPDAHNDRLSLMRADAVARKLVSMGISAENIRVSGAGERSPAMRTADGVEEPMNRRTVIYINI